MLNILGILPHSIGGRLTISSIFDGFKQLGHNVLIFDELSSDSFTDFIKGKSFDYLVGYDFSGIKLKADNNLTIPTINYFSDVIEGEASGVKSDWTKYYDLLKDKANHTFYWDRVLSEKITDIPNLHYFPHFVNCEIYKPMDIKEEYDIMFAGRLDTALRLSMMIDIIRSFPDLKVAWFAIEKHYQDALSRCDDDDKKLIENAYKGFIDNETKMAEEINKSHIVYNINAQGESSLNYRTMQVMACKKLLISDFREELNLFDGNVPFYINPEDLKDKIRYYTNTPQAYEFVTQKCYETVSTRLNSKTCVDLILKIINK